MMIAKNDEENRSKLWQFVTTVTSIIIVLIAAFFVIKLFMGNPLKGEWESVDDSVTLSITNGDHMTVEWDDVSGADDVKVDMEYTLDKRAKMIQIKADEKSLERVRKRISGGLTEQRLNSLVEAFTMTFDYSLEQNELILTEREYGEQMVFIKDE